MDENDTPLDDGTVTDSADDYATSVDALADILGDPDEPDTDEDEVSAEDDSDEAEDPTNEGDEPDEDGDDVEDDDESEEDSGDESAEEAEDGPEELKGGRIAPQNAKVKLPDGSLTTVDELLKGYHRQSDYTRKMQGISEDRKALEADRERASQTAQQLQEQYDRASAMLDAWKPQQPQTTYEQDPMAWGKYQADMAAWSQWNEQIGTQLSERQKQVEEEQSAQRLKYLQNENTQLVEKIPQLADDAKRKAFFSEASKAMSEFGFSQEDIAGITDHRLVVVMRELMRLKRNSQQAPQVKQQLKEKPKMLKGGKRSDPKSVKATGAKSRLSRLSETGSVRDGVASLMDLDL